MGLVRVLNLLWKQFRRRRMRKLEGVELDQEEDTESSKTKPSLRFLCRWKTCCSLFFRWFGFYRCRSQFVSTRLVHCRAILDLERFYAAFRVRNRKSERILSSKCVHIHPDSHWFCLCDVLCFSRFSFCTDVLCNISTFNYQNASLNRTKNETKRTRLFKAEALLFFKSRNSMAMTNTVKEKNKNM